MNPSCRWNSACWSLKPSYRWNSFLLHRYHLHISPPEKPTTNGIHRNEPSTLILALIYVYFRQQTAWCIYSVDLQCFLLFPYYFTQVYSFYNQFSSPSHHPPLPCKYFNPILRTPPETLMWSMKSDSFALSVHLLDTDWCFPLHCSPSNKHLQWFWK